VFALEGRPCQDNPFRGARKFLDAYGVCMGVRTSHVTQNVFLE
jgi:hypothetical protein